MSQPAVLVERRRTIRIKRSGLLRWKLADIDKPSIKFAETIDELQQAFALLHDTYLHMGYLKERKPLGLLYGIHTLLPETVVFIANSNCTVISTLTEIFDTEPFGLPMDSLYRGELDALRDRGRRVVELSALVTAGNLRWRNLFMYLSQVMYQYSGYRGVDDICIAVNPKHVRFYKSILLFEDLGPERYYPRVDAPAVALRINMDNIREKARDVYGELDFDCNLYEYFHRMKGYLPWDGSILAAAETSPPAAEENSAATRTVQHFLDAQPSLLDELTPAHKDYLSKAYPGLVI